MNGPLTHHRAARPLVSVVIPCYNHAHWLPESVASVHAQGRDDVEIIVVDDGSHDETAAVAGSLPGVRLVSQANAGLSAARNRGLREARGDLLIFLDADDLLLPGAIDAGVLALASEPEAAFAFGRYERIDADGSYRDAGTRPALSDDLYADLLRWNVVGMIAAVLFRREPLEAIGGFDTQLTSCEDWDVLLKLARTYPAVDHGTVVAQYRQSDASMSRNAARMLDTALSVLNAQRTHVIGHPNREAALRDGLRAARANYGGQLAAQVGVAVRQERDARRALRLTRDIARLAPQELPRAARGLVPPGTLLARVPHWLRGASPPLGKVRFGDLRRTEPIANDFGFDRGLPIDRQYIEWFLVRHQVDIRGRVLEIGDASYTRRFGGDRVTRSDVLHVHEGNPEATIVGDLADGVGIPSDAFDCLILTQTLHLIWDLHAAMQTIHRILAPGGILLATVPGISQIDDGEWGAIWHWSLTETSLRRLCETTFAPADVEIMSYGNVLAATAFLHGLAASEFSHAELAKVDPRYPITVAVRAVKLPGSP